MRLIMLCLFALGFGVVSLTAAPIDEAKKLYQNGNYKEAVDLLTKLRKASPRDGNVNYYLGASLIETGDNSAAVAPLKTAEERGVTDASRLLAAIALEEYDVDTAEEHLDKWSNKLAKSKSKNIPESLEEMRSRLVTLRNMLQRVEKIEIIDSINVDQFDFFTHYRLSPEAGRILLPEDADVKARTMVYVPQNNSEMIWAECDSTGYSALMSASILDDGTIDSPMPLAGEFSEGGDADYPFLMPDGMTLYYAATGETSLGGYDIFMTRRADDGFLQPQNMGFPYNSPYNDYMLAIDESTGAGWFASDRSQIPGKVTIYIFVPSQTRVNYSPDDPQLLDRARIKSIADTQTEESAAMRKKIAAIEEGATQRNRSVHKFMLSMGNGKIYTSLDDFKNTQARREMSALLKEESQIEVQASRLEQLRERYAKGEKSLANQILDAEAAIEFGRQSLIELRNKVIRLETR